MWSLTLETRIELTRERIDHALDVRDRRGFVLGCKELAGLQRRLGKQLEDEASRLGTT